MDFAEANVIRRPDEGRAPDRLPVDVRAVAAGMVADLDAGSNDTKRGVNTRNRVLCEHNSTVRAATKDYLTLAEKYGAVFNAKPIANARGFGRGASTKAGHLSNLRDRGQGRYLPTCLATRRLRPSALTRAGLPVPPAKSLGGPLAPLRARGATGFAEASPP